MFADDQDLTLGLDRMALDGKGRIFSFSKAWADKLAVYENGKWSPIPLSPADKPAQPCGILALRDGRVASVWNLEKNAQPSHRGGEKVEGVMDGIS